MDFLKRSSRVVGVALLMVVTSQAALIHGKTNFYKNLQLGIPQTIGIAGSSVSSQDWANYWPQKLVDTLNERFQYRVGYMNRTYPAGLDLEFVTQQPYYAARRPDLMIYEVGMMAPSSNYAANLRSVIHQNRVNLPNCEIVFWTPWPSNERPTVNTSNMIIAKQIAADSSIRWLETFGKMDSIRNANPSGYLQYLYDGFHPSAKCGDSIIIPAIIKMIKGIDSVNSATTVQEPEFLPYPGEFSSMPQSITMTCATSDATIRYTTDGTIPTASSQAYSAPISISANTTFKVAAFKSGMTTSSVATVKYSFVSLAPTLSLYPSGYAAGTQVTLACASSNPTIRYTTDGTEPTRTNGTTYSGPIPITRATVIKAMAYTQSLDNSKTESGLYFISDSIYTNNTTYSAGAVGPVQSGGTVYWNVPWQTPLIPCMFPPNSTWNKMVLEFDCFDSTGVPNTSGYFGFTLFDQGPRLPQNATGPFFPAHCLAVGHNQGNNDFYGYADASQSAKIWQITTNPNPGNGKYFFIPRRLPFLPFGSGKAYMQASYQIVFTKIPNNAVELSFNIHNNQFVWGPFTDTVSSAMWDQVVSSNSRNISAVLNLSGDAPQGQRLSIKNIRVTRMRDNVTAFTRAKAPQAMPNGTTQTATGFIVYVGEQGKHSVAVFDVKGKVAFSVVGTGMRQYTIPQKSIPGGVYLVHIKTHGKSLVKALTKYAE